MTRIFALSFFVISVAALENAGEYQENYDDYNNDPDPIETAPKKPASLIFRHMLHSFQIVGSADTAAKASLTFSPMLLYLRLETRQNRYIHLYRVFKLHRYKFLGLTGHY